MFRRIINYLFGLLCISCGIFFIVNPSLSLPTIINFIGIFMLLFGIIDVLTSLASKSLFLVRFGTNSAITNIIFGIIFIVFKDSIINVIPYLFGAYLIVSGVSGLLLYSVAINKDLYKKSLIKNIMYIVGGLIFVLTPIVAVVFSSISIGIIMCLFGIYVILSYKDNDLSYKIKVK